MASAPAKRLLLVIRQSPYGSSLARAALDVGLAAAAFERPVSLLFLGDGVLQLQAGQAAEALGIRAQDKLLASLPLYDIEQVYVDAEAAADYRLDLDGAPIATRSLDCDAVHRLLLEHELLLGF